VARNIIHKKAPTNVEALLFSEKGIIIS